ncbi:MAG: hypothetical protein WAN46_09540 [Gammaproteobacteria bacterium]|jgi:hypothetical protein
MSALEDLFDEDERAQITTMAADAHLSSEEFVRNIVLEVLDAHRADEMIETVERGEEPTMGLDELQDCIDKPY